MNQEHLTEELLAAMMFAIAKFESTKRAAKRVHSKWNRQGKSANEARKDRAWRRRTESV